MIGESDEYYGSQPFKDAYQKLRGLYLQQGISETEIEKLLVLDVKDASYFAGTGVTYQHGAATCSAVMKRLWGGCSVDRKCTRKF